MDTRDTSNLNDNVYTTSDGVRFKISHLIILFNCDDVYKICGINDRIFDDSINKELENIKTALDIERVQYGEYVPYFRIANILADNTTSDLMPDFTLLLIDSINTLKWIVYQNCNELIYSELKQLSLIG